MMVPQVFLDSSIMASIAYQALRSLVFKRGSRFVVSSSLLWFKFLLSIWIVFVSSMSSHTTSRLIVNQAENKENLHPSNQMVGKGGFIGEN